MELKHNLPTVQDLYNETEIVGKNKDFAALMNAEPPHSWIKNHPIISTEVVVDGKKIKKPLQYIPIERIEYLLTRIFSKWRVEIREVQLIANSVTVTVRLHYLDVVSGEWDWQDGIGAAPLQTDRGAGASDWNAIKSSSVQIGVPAAESYAIKDAAEKLGKLFGKDLNRADQVSYANVSPEITKQKLRERLSKLLKDLDASLSDAYVTRVQEAEDNEKDTVEFYRDIINEIKPSENV